MNDIRETSLYREAADLYSLLRGVGTRHNISDAAEIDASPNGEHAVFTGTLATTLEGTLPTRVCLVDLRSGDTRVLTLGPNTDRLPKYSPDGASVAFLSDRRETGRYQLFLLEPEGGGIRPAPEVDGCIEYLRWSPDGRRILLGVVDSATPASKRAVTAAATWLPSVNAGAEPGRARQVWVYDLTTDMLRKIPNVRVNIWEASWCGNDALVAVTSPNAAEGLWYSARLEVLCIATGDSRSVYVPETQLGLPTASPSGKYIAVVEALCSDRGVIAGDLRLIDSASGRVQSVNTHRVDITSIEWRSETRMLVGGYRGLESVIGLLDIASGSFTESWSGKFTTSAGNGVAASGLDDAGNCVLVGESFLRAPEIAVVRDSQYRAVRSLSVIPNERERPVGRLEHVTWRATDGLEIQGWLLLPRGRGPHPVIMSIHGGPVSLWRPTWLGRRNVQLLMLLDRGYAIFLPNPRGSSGRGQDFSRRVLGDPGGADASDLLSGLDHLVEQRIADATCVGITGVSYGAFLTAWLISNDPRFAAAVAVAPITHYVTTYLTTNIPQFIKLFLDDAYTNPDSHYFKRSPIFHAHKVRTPTLNICGALDQCTPTQETLQFHNALVENGVPSTLVRYPEEGHGIRKFPALIDYAARVVGWFQEHMPVKLNS